MYNNPYNFNTYMNNPTNMTRNFLNTGLNSINMVNAIPRMGMQSVVRPSLWQGIRNIKWGSFLNNTQKTLNVINQAIPVYYQVKPIWQNVKNLGRIVTAFNEPETSNNQKNNVINTQNSEKKENSTNQPTFFIN